jgi:nicotinate-nucleotide pyrophosphorylase (carboxylating)
VTGSNRSSVNWKFKKGGIIKKPKKIDKQARRFSRIVGSALREDIGRGDITTDSIVQPEDRALGVIFSKEDGVLCGVDIAEAVFKQLDPKVDFQKQLNDGSVLSPGVTIAIVIGRAAVCLKGERTALNFMQHLSGIATLTNQFVKAAQGRTKILDTRKTSPGLRIMEKYAVRVGGGVNHRFGLYDMVMIKDNHIQIAGSIAQAVARIRERRKKTFIEVEAQNLEEVKETIAAAVDRIMLDNMNPGVLQKAIHLVRDADRSIEIEVSGGVNLHNIAEIAESGADFVSIGALTHSARALDIALKIKPLASRSI